MSSTASSLSLKCQVIILNLSKRTSAKQLQQYASRYGSVLECYLTENEGEAFVEFQDRTNVDVFMSKRPHTIDGNELVCQRRLPSFELQKSVKRIFVRGTVQQLTDNRLANYFEKYGKVLTCTIPKGKRNHTFTHYGYAFVAFEDGDAVDQIIQDKPHYIDELELDIQKAEDLAHNRKRSTSRSPSPRSSRSSTRPMVSSNHKRPRRESLSLSPPPPPPPPAIFKRTAMRSTDEFTLRHIEDDNRRLREHAMMSKQHYDEDIWKLRRELDEERRRYDQLKTEFDHLRRDYARMTTELQQKGSSSSSRHLTSNYKRDLPSRH